MSDAPKFLHVYAGEYEHDAAYIVGKKEALVALRDAIDKALEKGDALVDDAVTGDGEGFGVFVHCVDGFTFKDLMLPYAKPDLYGQHPEGLHPCNIGKDVIK